MKFCLLTMCGPAAKQPSADFAFFIRRMEQLRDDWRHFTLSAHDIALLNPNTRTCPIFRSARDAELTKGIYRRVPVLINEGPPEENPWGVGFLRMFDMANDSNLFRTREQLEGDEWRLEGNVFHRDGLLYLPLYEAKMISQYDHRFASLLGLGKSGSRPSRKFVGWYGANVSDPHDLVMPQYWVLKQEVESRLARRWSRDWLLGWRDVTNAVNERTVIASVLPRVGVGHTLPLMLLSSSDATKVAELLANLVAFVFDYVARQKVGGMHLTYGYLNQLPVLPPDTYDQPAPWSAGAGLSDWIIPRVLALTYTARDIVPFARELGYDGPPCPWNEESRLLLRCELDAAFFHLYGIEQDDVDYVMETFPIVKRKDEGKYGEYRTKRVILETYDAMQRAMDTGEPYVGLVPAPGGLVAAEAP
jgi:hypothetical protein